jgi:hypothetical protein
MNRDPSDDRSSSIKDRGHDLSWLSTILLAQIWATAAKRCSSVLGVPGVCGVSLAALLALPALTAFTAA